ncbi:MAG: alanine racemase [Firmicutes bacterium]|mgnify:CR=1 FL=1|uniref:Alanine racemase, N-terminal domain n=1 Tax=Melghirimyces thermohalophilus TaxID=1236220 RepID=A0A1G6JS18_9BACL|nr:alanine racemase [Melghirimyces thermohalophilus]MDA8352541.1 alanine racemase [Bacillota bacterium]SDC21225.1 Alanine racemase, N-terminal domain [Melghirimyces thermohalophilus]
MSLSLYLDRRKWYRHIDETEQHYPGFVPVIKGNGYGFGNEYLAEVALEKKKKVIAVGTVDEARQLGKIGTFSEVIVLTPVMTELTRADLVSGRTYTVGSREQLRFLVKSFDRLLAEQGSVWSEMDVTFRLNILLKCESTMKRYGFSLQDAERIPDWIDGVQTDRVHVEVAGMSIHFPKERMTAAAREKQIGDWVRVMDRIDPSRRKMYLSHLTPAQYQAVVDRWPTIDFSIRLGTDLWLADKSFVETKSTVLDVKPIRRGERFGYKQLRSPRTGHLVYVAGGTANGVGLEAPACARGVKDWAKLTAFWLLGLVNRHLSPFSYRGKRLWFAEPPHMQTSVLLVPSGAPLPRPGEELPVQLRMTTAVFDRQVIVEDEVLELTERNPIPSQHEEKGNAVEAIP